MRRRTRLALTLALVSCTALLLTLSRPAVAAVAEVAWWPLPCVVRAATGTADDYLTGRLCPLDDVFVLARERPVWLRAAGVTVVGERRGECSWFPDTGPFWDFQVPCKGHDYCWDILRARRRGRYAAVTKARCDALLLDAMLRHCASRSTWRAMCRLEARTVYSAVVPFQPRP